VLNATILIVATLVVAITPATISFPVELAEAIVLVAGLAAILVLNAFALRAAFAPLDRVRRSMRAVDPYRPTRRLEASGPEEVRELVVVFNDMLDRLEGERRESARGALAAQEGERRRVAQELHDDVGQALTGVLLRLESLARRTPPDLLADVRAAQEATRETIDRVSLVVRQLRPEALTDLGLAKALASLARRVEAESGLRIRQRLASDVDDLDEESELVVYRVAQESLTNAVRHAQATEVELVLERTDDRGIVLRVRDNGRGLRSAPPPRYGILGMRERAMLIGATLTIENRADGGVEVTLTAPPPDERRGPDPRAAGRRPPRRPPRPAPPARRGGGSRGRR
jgi:two-component system sensor histidine kinase UhpB